jgi:hypothetical protein
MTTETYLQLTTGWRGQLETGFKELTILSSYSEPAYLSTDQRKIRAPEGEDLSWMNPRNSKLNQERLQKAFARITGKKRQRWLAALRSNSSKQTNKPRKHRHGQSL